MNLPILSIIKLTNTEHLRIHEMKLLHQEDTQRARQVEEQKPAANKVQSSATNWDI